MLCRPPNRFLLLFGTIVKEGAVSAQAVERQSCVSTFQVRFRSFMMLAQVQVLGALMNLQIPVGILTLDHPKSKHELQAQNVCWQLGIEGEIACSLIML